MRSLIGKSLAPTGQSRNYSKHTRYVCISKQLKIIYVSLISNKQYLVYLYTFYYRPAKWYRLLFLVCYHDNTVVNHGIPNEKVFESD